MHRTTRHLSVWALLGIAAVAGSLTRPPSTLGDMAWAQLRLSVPGQTPVRQTGRPQVLRHVTHRLTTPPVRRVASAKLFQGMTRVTFPGVHGVTSVVRTVRIGGDGIARPSGQSTALVRRASPTTVLVGTQPVHYVERGGVRYAYLRKISMVATAYNASYAQNGPWGATARLNGAPLTQGMVAVDPSIIPLGTRLYVDGYGPALAADTGSAIIGDRIDLFYDLSAYQTSQFGIRNVTVYILGPQSVP